MATAAAASRLSRSVLRELLKTSSDTQHCVPSVCNTHKTWRHIKDMIRDGRDYSLSDLQCYTYYLSGSRQHREVLSKYQGKGERSIEESANMVGLSLPPKDEVEGNASSAETKEQLKAT